MIHMLASAAGDPVGEALAGLVLALAAANRVLNGKWFS
jgi:hypothetical protein